MLDWKRICCAVDFSEPSTRALRVAAELARRIEASLTVVHVRGVACLPLTGIPAVPPTSMLDREREQARQLLERARQDAEALAPGRVTAELLEGDPAWEIVKFAAERGQDLLVVGTHGRTGVRRLVVGSIAEQVLRGAHCPVLAVREPGPTVE